MANDPGSASKTVFRGARPGVRAETSRSRLAANDASRKKKTVASKIMDCSPPGGAVEVVILGVTSPQETQDEIESYGKNREKAKPDTRLIEVLVNGPPTYKLVRPPQEHPRAVDRGLAIEEPPGAEKSGVAAHASENLGRDPETSEDE